MMIHRLLICWPTPSYVNADRFHLHLSLLREVEHYYDEAEQLLDIGKARHVTQQHDSSWNTLRNDKDMAIFFASIYECSRSHWMKPTAGDKWRIRCRVR